MLEGPGAAWGSRNSINPALWPPLSKSTAGRVTHLAACETPPISHSRCESAPAHARVRGPPRSQEPWRSDPTRV